MKPRIQALVLVAALALLPLAGCNQERPSTINTTATLTGKLPYNPLGWRVVTSWLNNRSGTMSTLYGNDVAVQYARSNSARAYPAGSVLALVTWAQRDDPHWFGAKIPSAPQSVEFVAIPAAPATAPTYERYEGSTLSLAASGDAARIDYILAQRAAVMP